jgi:hypothetical protein
MVAQPLGLMLPWSAAPLSLTFVGVSVIAVGAGA